MKNEKGVALIMVLWIITLLTVIVAEFSMAMRTEVMISQNQKDDIQLYAMATGGVERAVAELVLKSDPKLQELRKTLQPEEIAPEEREWVTDGRVYPVSYEHGKCEVRVTGEAGKININVATGDLLRKIIGNLELEGEVKDTVVDAILDWRDPDDLRRINGAENDYYQALPDPYNSRNGNLQSVEELLLVRGVSPEIFYGRRKAGEEGPAEKVGLKDIFTVYAAGEQVDINSAPLPVLRVVLGIPHEVCALIIRARAEKSIEGQVDLLQRVPEMETYFGEAGRLITYRALTPYYTIEARATKGERGGVRGVQALVKIDPKEKTGCKTIQWIDAIF